MQMKSIVTHGGGAHRDEFISVCLLLASMGQVPVFRRDPTPEELADPEVVVVDVGAQFVPALNNFDHHQKGAPEGCALTYVLEKLGLLAMARKIFVWLEFTERLDCTGPFRTAEWLGISKDAFAKTLSPIEAQILMLFEQSASIEANSSLAMLMAELGKGWLRYIAQLTERLAVLKRLSTVAEYDGVHVLFSAVDRKDNPVLGLEQYIRDYEEANGVKIGITVTQDDRGDGFCLFRREDHPRVDFSKLADRKDIVFAHRGGFVAKTTKDADPTYLIQMAIASEERPPAMGPCGCR